MMRHYALLTAVCLLSACASDQAQRQQEQADRQFMAVIQSRFANADRNHDRHLSPAEFATLPYNRGSANSVVDERFRRIDSNGDGRIDSAEFQVTGTRLRQR
ncbi:MAG: EF-hand domain-containing protein [Planctomycetota bacterium]|jgi:Ca2+-binding EF-hand superfamily protein